MPKAGPRRARRRSCCASSAATSRKPGSCRPRPNQSTDAALPVRGPRARKRPRLFTLDNPGVKHNFNVDCVSCHTTGTRAIALSACAAAAGDDRLVAPPGISGFIRPENVPRNEWNLRNFGIFTSASQEIFKQPTVSTRTLAEIIDATHLMNDILARGGNRRPRPEPRRSGSGLPRRNRGLELHDSGERRQLFRGLHHGGLASGRRTSLTAGFGMMWSSFSGSRAFGFLSAWLSEVSTPALVSSPSRSAMSKKAKKDQELFRGDDRSGVHLPLPGADPSIVRHILYLEGKGRATPYLSTSETAEVAERFDDTRYTAVWVTSPREAAKAGAGVIPLTELRQLLQGEGRGAARWSGKNAPWLVKRALQLAEGNLEHLLDFRSLAEAEMEPLIGGIFIRR